MRSRIKRDYITDVPEWSPVYGKLIKRVGARRNKDRAATEKCIFDALTAIARRGGIHSLKINNLAKEANVSKELIYRYFGGLENLIDIYAKKSIESLNTESEFVIPENPNTDEIRSIVKRLYRSRSELYFKNFDLRVVVREMFELRHGKARQITRNRQTSLLLKSALATLKNIPDADINVLDAVVVCTIVGMMFSMDCMSDLSGIDLNSEEGRERMHKLIDTLIDTWLNKYIDNPPVDPKSVTNKNPVGGTS